MQSIKEIMRGPAISGYTGSETTRDMVATEIESRWGKAEVKKYDPERNCLTFRRWLELEYRVKKGEKSIRSITFIEKKDAQGKVTDTYPRTVHLFYHLQVEKIA